MLQESSARDSRHSQPTAVFLPRGLYFVLTLYALCDECAVRLMKDDFVDDGALATEFNDEALQFEYAEPSALLRRKPICRLVIRLQHEMAFCIQHHPMHRRAALEIAN